MSPFEVRLNSFTIDPKTHNMLLNFYKSYVKTMKGQGVDIQTVEPVLLEMLEKVYKEIKAPTRFELYHKREEPYYLFGVNFIRPLIQMDRSTLVGEEILAQINDQIAKGENVILFANHQTEPDPQVISVMLEKKYPHLAKEMIAVAGQRVVTDPFAIPFSRGRNLLCIYSKRYIENPPEERSEKQLHNQRTLNKMKELLAEGGKFIYVAPSGGRDRKNQNNEIVLAPFDGNSIELFKIYAEQAKTKTHFYPFAMSTYNILPPPESIQIELGEERTANSTPVHIAFGKEIDMSAVPGPEGMDKKSKREQRALNIWTEVLNLYNKIHE